jgi:hypothetical protein
VWSLYQNLYYVFLFFHLLNQNLLVHIVCLLPLTDWMLTTPVLLKNKERNKGRKEKEVSPTVLPAQLFFTEHAHSQNLMRHKH